MRMRVLSGVVALGAALALPIAASAQDAGTPAMQVHVGPRTISTHTAVRVRFLQPITTGESGDKRSVETLQISGPSRQGCISATRVVLAAAPAGTMVRHTLRPRLLGGRWCTGTYQGQVTYQVEPGCLDPGPIKAMVTACPMLMTAPRTLATFEFRVTAR